MINVVCTTQAGHIERRLVDKPGLRIISPEKNREGSRYFPDGEVYVRIPGVSKLEGGAVVLHTGAPNPNAGIIEMFWILDILIAGGVKPIEMFFTYFPYGKQDDVFVEGEINAAEWLLNKITYTYGVGKIYIIDAHFSKRGWARKYPIVNVSALPLLKQAALQDYPDLLFLTPDIGGQKRTGLEGTSKKRLDSFITQIQSSEDFRRLVNGRRIGAVDDLLETGGTLVGFCDECIRSGALEILAIITHGVLEMGIKRVKAKFSKLYMANTINRPEANIDITDVVYNNLKT